MKPELIASPLYLRPMIGVPHRSSSHIHSLKRRRLKKLRRRSTTPTMSISVSLEGLFHDIISGFPHINSLELIVPAVGFVSGTAIYLSSQMYRRRKIPEQEVVRDWILFSSPTPFNRSVLLRCPALSFVHGGELLDDVSEQIVREERHFVNLDRRRIWIPMSGVDEWSEDIGVRYQRVCIRTDDGGVIAIDWPENLYLDKEQGFNTTVLLIPGSARGSLDGDVMSFVQEALRHGCFPVVMNPRGCAGSPIITPRLFTASDSDDIATAVQFVKQSRPWTTLMCVGWGYGSNMLTKYLSESGEEAAITATICIDSLFDLDEVTKSYPHCVALDQKLAHGFVDILQANKEIFQGKHKRFDVAKALSATTVREFDEAISMISYGYESIKEFYVRCNVRNSASRVRIPLLFIQSDESLTPFFSIPRDSIAENPYTSLLIPSSLPSYVNRSDKSTVVWCQHLAIEWLQAIELSLLKGRHPLLEDLNIPLNPSYDFPLLVTGDSEKNISSGSEFRERKISTNFKSENRKDIVEHLQSDAVNQYSEDPLNFIFGEGENAEQGLKSVNGTLQNKKVNTDSHFKQVTSANDTQKDDAFTNENSQALASAKIVLNMLDATRPGSLDNDQKRKVLEAVNQGETFINALQVVVPEDVREKFTSTISEIVQTQGTNLNIDELMKFGYKRDIKKDTKSHSEEKSKEIPSMGVDGSPDQKRDVTTIRQITNNQGLTSENSEAATPNSEMEHSSTESSTPEEESFTEGKHDKVIQSQKIDRAHENDQMTVGETVDVNSNKVEKRSMESGEILSTDSDNDSIINKQRKVDDSKEAETGQDKIDQNVKSDNSSAQMTVGETVDVNSNKVEKGSMESSEILSTDSGNDSTIDKQGKVDDSKEAETGQDKIDQDVKSDNSSAHSPAPINVSEALNAFVSFDDSSQIAVNTVFGVIENLIDHMEKKKDENGRSENKDDHLEITKEKRDNNLKAGKESKNGNPKFEEDDKDKVSKKENMIEQLKNHPSQNIVEEKRDEYLHTRDGRKEKTPRFSEESRDMDKDTKEVSNSAFGISENMMGQLDKQASQNTKENSDEKLKAQEKNRDDDPIAKSFPISIYTPEKVELSLESDVILSTNKFKSDPDIYAITPEDAKPDKQKELASDGLNNDHACTEEDAHCHPPKLLDQKNWESSYNAYLGSYLSKSLNMKSLNTSSTTDQLFYADKRQWEMPNQSENDKCSIEEIKRYKGMNENVQNQILDGEQSRSEKQSNVEIDTIEDHGKGGGFVNITKPKLMCLVKDAILNSLEVEVNRSLGSLDIDMEAELASDIEMVADGVSYSVLQESEMTLSLEDETPSMKFGTIQVQFLVGTISSTVQNTTHLRNILPIGVIIGSSLASLGEYLNISDVADSKRSEARLVGDKKEKMASQESNFDSRYDSIGQEHCRNANIQDGEKEKLDKVGSSNGDVLTKALTTITNPSSLIPYRQKYDIQESFKRDISGSNNNAKNTPKVEDNAESSIQDTSVNSIIETPTSIDTVVSSEETDKERKVVSVLTELGQRGGFLSYFGNIAILWGGIRGAMNLTDKLINFLDIAERSLFQRIVGFVFMVLVLWSPVAITLLPNVVQSWMDKSSYGIAGYACLAGLNVAILILVMLWGKRIRGYEYPLKQYGLNFPSISKVFYFLRGLIGGTMLVLSVHLVNTSLGFACFVRPPNIPELSSGAKILVKEYGNLVLLFIRGILTASWVSFMEELWFRSWLPDEISLDFEYHWAIIVSGLAFALFQRSVSSAPAFLFLSLALSGLKKRDGGSLFIPIGFRSGIMLASLLVHSIGFVNYKSSNPLWVASTQSQHPFDGIVGLSLCILLAIFLYPRQTHTAKEKIERNIKKQMGDT